MFLGQQISIREPTWCIYSSFLLILGRHSATVNNRHWSDLFNFWRLNSRCVRAILQQGWQTKAELTTRNRYYVGQGLWLTLADVHFSKLDKFQALKWMPMGFMTQGDWWIFPLFVSFLFFPPVQVSRTVPNLSKSSWTPSATRKRHTRSTWTKWPHSSSSPTYKPMSPVSLTHLHWSE